MSAGHRTGTLPVTPEMVAKLTPEILAEIGKAVNAAAVDRTHDVPGIANRSKDGRTMYLDRNLPTRMHAPEAFDPAVTLVWHEIPEWVLMNHGIPYEEAHAIVTEKMEKPKVLSLGLNWAKYQEAMGGEIAENEKRKVVNLPPDIDVRPFQEEPDPKALAEVAKAVGQQKIRLIPVDHDPFVGGGPIGAIP